MKNNAMHYKMYKAKKNIVYAGLVTTAVLAGLTLTNVNNNANADTVAQPATTAVTNEKAAATTTTNNAAVQSAQAAVTAASNNVTSAQAAVSNAQANVASAQNLNSDVAAVSKANDAYKQALAQQDKAGQASTQAQSNFVAASAAASAAIHTAATQKGFGETDTTTNNAAQQAVAYWNAVSAQTSDTLASVAAARPAVEAKYNQKHEDYTVQSNYVADLATKVNNLKSELASQQAASASSAAIAVTSNALTSMQKRYDTEAYQLNTTYAYQNNSAQTDVTYLNNVTAQANKDMSQVSDALTKISAYLTAKAANELAYQNARAAVAATSRAEKAYVEAMNAHNLPNSQQLQQLEENAATANNFAKSYQDQLNNNAAYSAANSAVTRANNAQSNAQASVNNYSAAVASDQAALTSANNALSDALAQVASATTEAEKTAAAAARANAEDAVSRAQAQLDNDKANLTAANKQLRNANKLVKTAQDNLNNVLKSTVTVNEGANAPAVSMKLSDLVNLVNDWNSRATAATNKLNAAKSNLASVADVQATLDTAEAELATAQANLTAAQGAYQTALDALNALQGVTSNASQKYGNQLNNNGNSTYTKPATQAQAANASEAANAAANDAVTTVVPAPTPAEVAGTAPVDQIANVVWTDPAAVNAAVAKGAGTYPLQVTVNWTDGSQSTINWNLTVNEATTPVNPDTPVNPGNNTNNGNQNNNNGNQNTTTNGVVSGFTGVNGSNYYVNGQQVTKAQYEAYVANKAQQNGSQASAATLPQTGNENSAAIVALGAVSAMFGLGLAAKKREF
ncbi:LPXTG cell wall anchor domain-containing protein [Limosilactobacillus sp.]|uniref:LPXTG cell wall anchor domain-containing protein n=1 Tax=Limosilactobacillus sp. TaxID=2773925 RepID=UPI003F0D44AF